MEAMAGWWGRHCPMRQLLGPGEYAEVKGGLVVGVEGATGGCAKLFGATFGFPKSHHIFFASLHPLASTPMARILFALAAALFAAVASALEAPEAFGLSVRLKGGKETLGGDGDAKIRVAARTLYPRPAAFRAGVAPSFDARRSDAPGHARVGAAIRRCKRTRRCQGPSLPSPQALPTSTLDLSLLLLLPPSSSSHHPPHSTPPPPIHP